jgi:acetyl esterase
MKYPIHPDFKMLRFAPNLTNRRWTHWYNFLLRTSFNFVRVPQDIEVSTQIISGYQGGTFEALIIRPKNIIKNAPCLVYYHGGAFFLEPASTHKESSFVYAKEAQCVVILPLFRLSIKHPFPTTIEDSYLALVWAAKNAEKLGIDEKKIAVGGDSSGGSIAAVVSQMALDRGEVSPCFQMLIYAAFDHTMTSKSMKNYTNTPFSNTKTFEVMWREYLQGVEGNPPYISALERDNFANLPPAYIETAEFDPIHDEGILYAQKLQEAGVAVVLHETKGTIHAYDTVKKSTITIESVQKRINTLKKIL